MKPRTTIVTGAGSGIGKATALLLAAEGDLVFCCDRAYTDAVSGELTAADVHLIEGDVRETATLGRLATLAIEQTGRIDVWVNNAGTGLVKQLEDVQEFEWDAVIDTNLKAAFFGCQQAVRQMQKQDNGGAIVNVASNAGILPRSHDPVYSISKLSLVGLTRSLALCHSKDRIRINCVCPGPVEHTQIIEENFEGCEDRDAVVKQLIQASPLARSWGRMIQPEEVAESIHFLCSDAAQMISGTSVAIDGGKSLGVPPAEENGAAPALP